MKTMEEVLQDWEAVIGLEVHCELTKLETKMFCGCKLEFGEISDPTSMYLSDMFTISINIAGNGGMSLPAGLGADTHLPVGVQLIGPQFKDENMFRAAAALEQVYGKAPIAPDFAGA